MYTGCSTGSLVSKYLRSLVVTHVDTMSLLTGVYHFTTGQRYVYTGCSTGSLVSKYLRSLVVTHVDTMSLLTRVYHRTEICVYWLFNR